MGMSRRKTVSKKTGTPRISPLNARTAGARFSPKVRRAVRTMRSAPPLCNRQAPTTEASAMSRPRLPQAAPNLAAKRVPTGSSALARASAGDFFCASRFRSRAPAGVRRATASAAASRATNGCKRSQTIPPITTTTPSSSR
jgi:hypothetical protein